MQRQNVRVVLASEHSQIRYFLSEVIEQEGGVDVTGQAQDASKALTLVKNLRPDVAVIDSYLPHDAGLEAIPMSRINGLDTAQAILEETPNTRVILLNNLDAGIFSGRSLSPAAAVAYSIASTGADISLVLQDLGHEVVQPNDIVFASIEVKQQAVLQQKATRISDKVIFFGALSFAGGWLITLTVFLAPVGVPIAIAGAAMAILGLLGKLTASLWRKIKNGTKGD